MAFAESGQEALDILDGASFDVLVTDIRMPGMDGVELLENVRKLYPTVVRLALSGHADREAILRGVMLIHQFLSKPCDADTLKSTLSRSFALSDLLADERLQQLVSQMGTLPSLPSLYGETVDKLQSPDVSVSAVGEIISRDMGMSAKVLQLVNSVVLGVPQHISDPVQAVGLLGLEVIRTLVFSVNIFSQVDLTKLDAPLTSLWDHCVTVGKFARRIAETENDECKLANDAFMAGLLHDTGRLVLGVNLPKEYGSALALASKGELSMLEAEREIFGTTHSEVGAYLLGLWGLPNSIVATAAFHHKPMESLNNTFDTLTAVHVANALEHAARPTSRIDAASRLDVAYLAELDLAERLPAWQEICQEAIQQEEDNK